MTLNECKMKVKALFEMLYPKCTVIFENSDTARPAMPYIVLRFGATSIGGKNQEIVDGVIRDYRTTEVAVTVEMVANSPIRHSDGTKNFAVEDTLQSLMASIPFLSSDYAGNWMWKNGVVIEPDGNPFPVYNSLNGVSTINRAQCAYVARFIQVFDDYAALRPAGGTLAQTSSGPSAEIAAEEAGYFESAEITI